MSRSIPRTPPPTRTVAPANPVHDARIDKFFLKRQSPRRHCATWRATRRDRRDATRDVRFRRSSIRFPARADARDRSFVRRARGDDDVENIALDVARFVRVVGRSTRPCERRADFARHFSVTAQIAVGVRACEDALDARDDADDNHTPDDVVDSATVCAEWTTVALARCDAAALESRGRARGTDEAPSPRAERLARVLGAQAPSVDDPRGRAAVEMFRSGERGVRDVAVAAARRGRETRGGRASLGDFVARVGPSSAAFERAATPGGDGVERERWWNGRVVGVESRCAETAKTAMAAQIERARRGWRLDGARRATNARPSGARIIDCVDYELTTWGVVERWSTSSETGDEATRTACEAAMRDLRLSSVVRQEHPSRARRVREPRERARFCPPLASMRMTTTTTTTKNDDDEKSARAIAAAWRAVGASVYSATGAAPLGAERFQSQDVARGARGARGGRDGLRAAPVVWDDAKVVELFERATKVVRRSPGTPPRKRKFAAAVRHGLAWRFHAFITRLRPPRGIARPVHAHGARGDASTAPFVASSRRPRRRLLAARAARGFSDVIDASPRIVVGRLSDAARRLQRAWRAAAPLARARDDRVHAGAPRPRAARAPSRADCRPRGVPMTAGARRVRRGDAPGGGADAIAGRPRRRRAGAAAAFAAPAGGGSARIRAPRRRLRRRRRNRDAAAGLYVSARRSASADPGGVPRVRR